MVQIADRSVLNWSGPNRPRVPLTGFHATTAHETDNEKAGANAAMHATYVTKSGGGGASYHLCADKDESVQLLELNELGYHIGDGADQPLTDEAFYTVGGEICVNDRAGYPAACARMAKAFAAVLFTKNRPAVKDVTVRMHGSYYNAITNPEVHSGCPKHMRANALKGDWGVSWQGFNDMVSKELSKLTGTVAGASEADNQKLLFDTVARDFLGTEVERYLGSLVREGRLLAKAGGFGESNNERVAIYQKMALHTLNGQVYGFFDEAAALADPAVTGFTVAGLQGKGLLTLY